MLLKYFYDDYLAQASYLVGCAATGEALVIDAGRDISMYLRVAEDEGLRITHVTETHIHADYVSGSRELAHHTGARLYLSDMGDQDWKYAYADDKTILLRDKDWWMVGNVRVDVIHTPGHTPEHLSFMITDTAAGDKPMGIFTGDFLFAGNIGRPDLLEEAAGFVGTREIGARQQFANVQRFKSMPDYFQIWPGHGAGSACGKGLGSVPSSTLGYEKLINPAFQIDDEDSFVDWLLEGQPEAPRYFARMKMVNKVGPTLLENVPQPEQLQTEQLDDVLAEGALIIDVRAREDYSAISVPGTINIPLNSERFNTYVGWFVDYDEPVYLIMHISQTDQALKALRAIGVDNIAGYFMPDVVHQYAESLPQISAVELAQRLASNGIKIVDVRGASEYDEMHVAGAINIPLGYIERELDRLPKHGAIVTQCASGMRSQIAASILKKHGFSDVTNLDAAVEEWEPAGLPVEY